MQQFLDRFAATIGKSEHVVMVLDQAGWHDSRALSVPANVTLVALPPYSPELNPVERVWLYLKERFLSHRLHDDYEAIVDAPARLGGASPPRPAASNLFAPTPGSRRSRLRVDGMKWPASGPMHGGELAAVFRAALRVEPHITALLDHLEAEAPLGFVQPIVAFGWTNGRRGG